MPFYGLATGWLGWLAGVLILMAVCLWIYAFAAGRWLSLNVSLDAGRQLSLNAPSMRP